MDYSTRHSFGIRKPYNKKEAVSYNEYLDTVIEVEKGIAAHAVESEAELYWTGHNNLLGDGAVNVSLGYGVSGVVYFYIQLYTVTKDEKYVEIIRKSLNYIANHWKEIIPPKPHKYPWPDGMHYGIYGGLGGVGSVLTVAYKVFGWESILNTLDAIVDYLKSTGTETKDGIIWTGSPTTMSDGGILMFLTSLYEVHPTQELKDFIENAGNAYISEGMDRGEGLEFSDYETCKLSEPDFPHKVSQPNFELGSAGSGFILGRLYQVLGDEKYLEAAKKVDIYLDTIKVTQEKGFLLPYRVGDPQETIFYLGNCHGAAGTAKFYFILYRITGEQKYLDEVHSLFDGFESLGAPNHMSAGLWNNISVCCGQSGILNTFIGLYQSTKEERWHKLAKQSAAVILGEKDELEDGYQGWPIAFRRIRPDEFSSTIYYNDGTAGAAAALLRIYMAETGVVNPNSLADDPFTKE